MCRNSVHKVADLARPQCLTNSEIYYIFRWSFQALRLAFGVPNDFGELGMSTEPKKI